MAAAASACSSTPPKFLIVNPHKGRKRDLVKYLVGKDEKSGMKFWDSSLQEGVKVEASHEYRLNFFVAVILIRILNLIDMPLKYLGYVVDFFLNLLSQNGGFFGILTNSLHGSLKIPKRGSENFVSTIGQLDGRIDLYRTTILSEKVDSIATDVANIKADLGNMYLMDLCVMASKLVYENHKVVQNVIDNHWKMHFVGFYNCWNEAQKESNTQVFICCDKPKDANLIIVSFRGTEPFNAQDWASDFDLSYYEIPKVGKFHMGFLEALGLGDRDDASTFQTHLQRKHAGFFHLNGESEGTIMEWAKKSAYYAVTLKLKSLLKEHKNAKFVVTGHSLGGALAIMYPCILVVQEETEMLHRLLNIYTFGQPRIGDKKLGTFMESHLNYPVTRYFRVVYCNDIVPRVPFEILGFKHFGTCLYYDSRYLGRFMDEEPNRNFFGLRHMIPMRANAMWELLRSFMVSHAHGADYEETWFCILFRLMGLVLPGVAGHSPVDYVNSVRLGRERVIPMTSLKSFARKL